MSQKQTATVQPCRAENISSAWLEQVRGIIERDGHAMRPGAAAFTIEVDNINQPEVWLARYLQVFRPRFATAGDRDAVLAQLLAKAS